MQSTSEWDCRSLIDARRLRSRRIEISSDFDFQVWCWWSIKDSRHINEILFFCFLLPCPQLRSSRASLLMSALPGLRQWKVHSTHMGQGEIFIKLIWSHGAELFSLKAPNFFFFLFYYSSGTVWFHPLVAIRTISSFFSQRRVEKKDSLIFSTRFHFSIVQNLIDLISFLFDFISPFFLDCYFCRADCEIEKYFDFAYGWGGFIKSKMSIKKKRKKSLIWLSSLSRSRAAVSSRHKEPCVRFPRIVWKWRFALSPTMAKLNLKTTEKST